MRMSNNKSCLCSGCTTTGVILGIIFGAVLAVLFSSGFIPLIITGLWIAFGLAAFALVFILGALAFSSCGSGACAAVSRCIAKNIGCLLTGIIGTILTALAALSVTLDIAITGIIILIAFAGFFFTLLIVSLIYLIKCLVTHSE